MNADTAQTMEISSYYDPDARAFVASVMNIMGTKFEMIIPGDAGKDVCSAVFDGIVSVLGRTGSIADRFDPASEVSRINAAEPVSMVYVSELMADMLKTARDYSMRTGGLFDITLEGKWDFDFSPDGALVVPCGGIKVDFGGFAKGYALKKIRNLITDAGIRRAFVNFGNSSICAIGAHPYGDAWKVSLPDPFTGKILKVFDLKDMCMSTSGNTPHYTGHIVDPRTGRPDSSTRTSVIIARDALDAEVLSTVWLIAGDTAGKDIASGFDIESAWLF